MTTIRKYSIDRGERIVWTSKNGVWRVFQIPRQREGLIQNTTDDRLLKWIVDENGTVKVFGGENKDFPLVRNGHVPKYVQARIVGIADGSVKMMVTVRI